MLTLSIYISQFIKFPGKTQVWLNSYPEYIQNYYKNSRVFLGRYILGLSQETYINKVLKRFRMENCSSTIAPIMKGDMFSLDQYRKNNLER